MGRKPRLDDSTWKWVKTQYEVENKSWKIIAGMLDGKGIKISKAALSKRYVNESAEKTNPQPGPSKTGHRPQGSSTRSKLTNEVETIKKDLEKLMDENSSLKHRLTFLEDLVKIVIGDKIPEDEDPAPEVKAEPKRKKAKRRKAKPTHNHKANCPLCGKVSKIMKSRNEMRFYCPNKKCKRKTFISR